MSTHYRTIWISDTHLGFRAAQVGRLLSFLKDSTCDHLFLVGDIVDIWELRRKMVWDPECSEVIRRIIKIARTAQVVYVPGNHDQFLSTFCGSHFGNISIQKEAVHQLLDGRRLLVTHGDEFDLAIQHRLVFKVGWVLYDALVWANHWTNHIRSWLGLPHWSLAECIRRGTKEVCLYVSDFEHTLAWRAESQGLDGVVCGHVHHARVTTSGDDAFPLDMVYCNCGDWVEHCTALVETTEGKLVILDRRPA